MVSGVRNPEPYYIKKLPIFEVRWSMMFVFHHPLAIGVYFDNAVTGWLSSLVSFLTPFELFQCKMFSFNAVQLFTLANLLLSVTSFTSPHSHHNIKSGINVHDRKVTTLLASGDEYAPSITGAELEVLLTDFETPLVVDAYATW